MMKKIAVVDFGGQYAHLIAKRFRGLGYYAEIVLPDAHESEYDDSVMGIVLSGGPSSVYAKDTPEFNNAVFDLKKPVLGLCYGHQIMLQHYGGKVEKAKVGEYGFARLINHTQSPLFNNIEKESQVWMSHSDEVTLIPAGFETVGSTADCKQAVVQNLELGRFGLQFHGEVKDTPIGDRIFENFALFCGMEVNWDTSRVLELILSEIREEAGDKKVLLFLSGGVDSSVAFALLNSALGKDRVLGLYINNGFMRKGETESIREKYHAAGYDNFMVEDGEKIFLDAVGKETDPQKKRKIIGETFITVRDHVVERLDLDEDLWLLAQGTLYPDIIESGGSKHAHVIKTHHNRVDGIQQLIEKGLVIEPLKELYKDEVRVIGRALGLPEQMVMRHPFPGPGISINTLCSKGTLDQPGSFEKANAGLAALKLPGLSYKKLYALPVKSVGVQGDFRTYTYPAALDLGTDLEQGLDWQKLDEVSSFITNSISDVNRTVLKLFQKKECSLTEAYCDKQRLDMIREVDSIVLEHLKKSGWYEKVFQHLTINIPYGASSSSCSIVLRPVVSEDVMTARFARLDLSLLLDICADIKKLDFVDALFYDITNKPPATFGWE